MTPTARATPAYSMWGTFAWDPPEVVSSFEESENSSDMDSEPNSSEKLSKELSCLLDDSIVDLGIPDDSVGRVEEEECSGLLVLNMAVLEGGDCNEM
ncbi:hypothetical protein EV177_009912, partial [Coemansia sp. RSA 1804]